MNLLGDVPEKDKELASKLEAYEKELDSDKKLPNEVKAQCYVCLAYDWCQIGMEEEGNRLLFKAEETRPGYFKHCLPKHIKENRDFDILVRSFTVDLMWIAAEQMKGKK